jgi:class 3 adenylate cyclase
MAQVDGGDTDTASIRDLTVMYLDVVGYMNFAERHTPRGTAKMLNDLFGICEVITRECQGDIDKFIGDALT